MTKSTEGHVAICTLVDTATGFTIVCDSVVEVLRKWFFPYFGIPRSIVTDKGKENVNSEIQALTAAYNIDHVVSSTGYPQSNGMVERRQSMILQFFRKTCNTMDDQNNWHKHCAELQTIINSTSHQGTLTIFPYVL